jgi:hypothetical protein
VEDAAQLVAGPDVAFLDEDVGLRDDAENAPEVGDNRDPGDPTLRQDRGDIPDRRLRPDRDDVGRHHVSNAHAVMVAPPEGRRIGVCRKASREISA